MNRGLDETHTSYMELHCIVACVQPVSVPSVFVSISVILTLWLVSKYEEQVCGMEDTECNRYEEW